MPSPMKYLPIDSPWNSPTCDPCWGQHLVVIRSARATITPTSFVNEYHWGSLKGDPADWMRRYFDAFIHVANWRSCRLALRVPRSVFNKAELMQYATGDYALTVDAAGSHWIID